MLKEKKSSYLKFSPEDFQKKLQEYQDSNTGQKREFEIAFEKHNGKDMEEEKCQRNSFGSSKLQTESDFGGDIIDTQVESIRTSQVKLS